MKILVTGGTGFIGKEVVRRLSRSSHTVQVMRRNEFLQIIEFQPDAIIHLAWEGLPDYASQDLADRNLLFARTLFSVVQNMPCVKTVLAAGTCWEYGYNLMSGKVCEDVFVPVLDKNESLRPFLQAKRLIRLEGERLLSGKNFIWVRPFFVYGPDQRASSLLPTMYKAFKENQIPKIKTPKLAHDFIHVEDVADAIVKLVLQNAPKGTYNIGTGHPRTVSDAVNLLADHMGKDRMPESKSFGGMWADPSKLSQTITGWHPRSLWTGIRETVEAWESRHGS